MISCEAFRAELGNYLEGDMAADNRRMEITGRDSDIYKFRANTMRQLKGSRFFFHNGAFTNVRDVVEYFNHGVPQNPVTGAASTFEPRFTHPRGPGSSPGLGLNDDQVNDITDFLENALSIPRSSNTIRTRQQ